MAQKGSLEKRILKLVGTALKDIGFEPREYQSFNHRINADTEGSISLRTHNHGPAGRAARWLEADFGIRNRPLHRLYDQLNGQESPDYFSVAGQLHVLIFGRGTNGWEFQDSDFLQPLTSFRQAIQEHVLPIFDALSEADRILDTMMPGNHSFLYWDFRFWVPIGHLYRGNIEEAVAFAERHLLSIDHENGLEPYLQHYTLFVQKLHAFRDRSNPTVETDARKNSAHGSL